MTSLLGKIQENYQYVFYDLCEPKSVDLWPSPLFIFTVMPFYLYFSTRLGPNLMKDRKPFKLKRVIFYYNIFQIFISAFIFYEGLHAGWWPSSSGYSWTCQPYDSTDNPKSRRMLNAFWWYTLVKFIDLLDTVFFILRKKDRQISFLHLFHHFMMPIASYIGLKYFPNGHASLLGLINAFVHVVMYTYYLISGLGPKYQKYLWWKKHLTTMQLIQFGIIFFHNLIALLSKDCTYPKWISAVLCIHSLQFIYMFGNFYYVNYIKNQKQERANGSVKSETGKSKVN